MRGFIQAAITMGLMVFTIVSIIMFTQFFSFRTTVLVTEQTLSDPSLPFMQALSYQTVSDCGGKKVKYYDVMAALSSRNALETKVCGQDLSVEPATRPGTAQYLLISTLYSTFLTNSTRECFEYALQGNPPFSQSGSKNVLVMYLLHSSKDYYYGTAPSCQGVLAALGGKAVSSKATPYFFPLPPNLQTRKATLSEHVLTKFSGT